MQLEILIPSEGSQKEKEVPYDITSMWNLKYGTNEPVHKTETDDGYGEQTCGCHGDGRKWDGLGVWDW